MLIQTNAWFVNVFLLPLIPAQGVHLMWDDSTCTRSWLTMHAAPMHINIHVTTNTRSYSPTHARADTTDRSRWQAQAHIHRLTDRSWSNVWHHDIRDFTVLAPLTSHLASLPCPRVWLVHCEVRKEDTQAPHFKLLMVRFDAPIDKVAVVMQCPAYWERQLLVSERSYHLEKTSVAPNFRQRQLHYMYAILRWVSYTLHT